MAIKNSENSHFIRLNKTLKSTAPMNAAISQPWQYSFDRIRGRRAGLGISEIEMATIKSVFAANLRRLCREQDLKAKDLANELGVSPSMVTHWRNGDFLPSEENFTKIRQALRVSYSELFREDLDPNPADRNEAIATLRKIAKLVDRDRKAPRKK